MLEDSSEITGWFVCGTVGAITLVIGLGMFLRMRGFIASSMTAEGRVVAINEDDDDDGKSYAPRVRFTASNGASVEFTDKIYSRRAQYKVGTRVKVFYHRDDYDRASLGNKFDLYFTSLLLIFVGMLFLSIGLLGVVLTVWLSTKIGF